MLMRSRAMVLPYRRRMVCLTEEFEGVDMSGLAEPACTQCHKAYGNVRVENAHLFT